MENVNVGILIGTVSLLIAIVALIAAVFVRFSRRTSPGQLLQYFFYAGIPVLFLISAAGLWDAYQSADWTKCLVPLGLLCLAVNALVVCTRGRSEAS